MGVDFEKQLNDSVVVGVEKSFADLKTQLDGLMEDSNDTLETLLNLDTYDPSTRRMPLWVNLLEKTIKKSLIQYAGVLPKPLASLYSTYLLEAIEWMNRELAKANFYEKKIASGVKRAMATEKAQAKINGKDSETARERWVLEQSVIYADAEEASNKAYAFLGYLKSRADSLTKEYYLCYKFLEGVGLSATS